MDNKFKKYIQSMENYKKSLFDKTMSIINILNKKYKLLTKKEKQVLNDYKEEGYKQLKIFLTTNEITFEKFYNKIYIFSDEIEFKEKEVNLYDIYKNIYYTLKYKINIMDNIFLNKSHFQNINVYKGVRAGKTQDNLMKLIKNNSPTKSMIVDEYLSSSLDLNIAIDFMKNGNNNILIQIETQRCPYIYMPWKITETGNLKNENSIDSKNTFSRKSEFEILLPRGIELEYLGKEHLMNMQKKFKNWHN